MLLVEKLKISYERVDVSFQTSALIRATGHNLPGDGNLLSILVI
jgi:hypothetical protein